MMTPSVVEQHISNLFPLDQGDQPSYRYIFLSSDMAEVLSDILGSYANLYVYHLVTFSGGSRRLIRPNGTCVFNPEQTVDSFGTGPNSLTAQLGFIDYDKVLKVYSLLDIKQLRPRKDHTPVGTPAVDLAAVLTGVPGSYKLSRAAGDAIAGLYHKIKDPDKKHQFKAFFKDNYNYTIPGTVTNQNFWYGSTPVGDYAAAPALSQEQLQAYANAQSQINTPMVFKTYEHPVKTQDFEAQILEDCPFDDTETDVNIDFVLPSKISEVVSSSTLHSVVSAFLTSLNKTSLKKGTYKVFFVVAGRHRGVVGILKNDLGTWLEIDVFDRINASRQAVLLGDCEHEPPSSLDEMEVALSTHSDQIKVAKCQTIPITYSVSV